LLEEERDACGDALVSETPHPVWVYWAIIWPAFPADNDPIDAIEREVSDGP